MAALVGGITTPLAIPLGCISLGAVAKIFGDFRDY